MFVISLVAVLLAIAIPNFLAARERSRTKSCIANMTKLQDAKERYAMEKNIESNEVVNWINIIPDYLKFEPHCPAGGNYQLLTVGEPVDCSYEGHDM